MRLSMIVLTASMAYGAVGNLRVRGVTATQAVLEYTAPDTSACSVAVSESPTYSPLVHDVDPVLFTGSNLDSRLGATASGVQRVFVAGQRKAEKGVDGRWYSRALRAFTAHYFRVTCGGSQASGTFLTQNIAIGNTYSEALPPDPAVGSRPYFTVTGSYAWPEFANWTDRTATVIDPQTGMLLKRLALPGDQPITYLGDNPINGVVDLDGAWTNPNNVKADDTAWASFIGAGSNMLLLSDNTFWFSGGPNLWDLHRPTESMVVSAKAWCSGTCAGENAKIQVCLSLSGVTCWPSNGTAKWQEATLGTSTLPSSYVTIGTTVPVLDAWTPAGYAPLTRLDLATRQGQVDVDGNGVATWKAGLSANGFSTYFSPNWTAGSKITIGSSVCTITARAGITQVTVVPAACSPALTVPVTGATYIGPAFGFLVRKKTASLDAINIQYVKYTVGTSQYMDFTSSGSARMCNDHLSLNAVTGGLGYHCWTSGDVPLLFWVDHVTGDANYLGLFGTYTVGTTPTAPEHYYSSDCFVSGESPCVHDVKVTDCNLTTTNQPGDLHTSCTDITPAGKGLSYLMAQFTAADTPAFDAAHYLCNTTYVQGLKLVVVCHLNSFDGDSGHAGHQDSLNWVGMFDPFLVSTAAGCVGGGMPGCIVAAQSTWGNAPRWCSMHTQFEAGNTSWLWNAGKYLGASHDGPGDGPYTSLITSGALTATPAIAAGTGMCPVGSHGCDLVTVDGEPCNRSPLYGENTGIYTCARNSSWAYLQDAKVGDTLGIGASASSVTEYMILLAKNGNNWTIQRGTGAGGVVAHLSTDLLFPQCSAYDYTSSHASSDWSWTWDTATDPHGTNSGGTTVLTAYPYDHPTPRIAVTIGGMPDWNTTCGSCYGARTQGSIGDPPDKYATYAPLFAGASGTSLYIERAQDHPSWLQENAPTQERKWLLDGRPLSPLMDISDSAVAVSGQLYKVTSLTTDGDNLSKVGYNIYTVKTGPTTLVAAGNCSAASPCPIWNDTNQMDSITSACSITLNSGSGSIFIYDKNIYGTHAGTGLIVRHTSGLALTVSGCTQEVGTAYPGTYDDWPNSFWHIWSWNATSPGVWDVTGSNERGGSSGYFGTITRKLQPTWAYCGTQALTDVSSAATGDVLGDTSADSYKYCVARKAGECRAASLPGDIYANCPNETVRGDGSYGCSWYSPASNDNQQDICVGNMSGYLSGISQVGFGRSDFTGALGRTLTKALGRYHAIDGYWHGKALSDSSWMLTRSMYLGGAWTDVILGKLPPFPPEDSVVRSTFQAFPVKLTPPAGLAVNNAVIQFGYAENGGTGQFFCTSRQEKCLATAAAVPAVPFVFPSEGTGGVETGVTGVSCATGCTVAIPAISQRMLYYQVKYRDASNRTVATSGIETVAVP